ncbi:VOC family protein [Nocardioides sp. zg-ZUI104]|uniref:VOC family protein n=1 Tax=Nocardioides faecalis TaxID=2803858 RepID=UPI001BCBD0B0|nr:VOC family protein [Nocardioides faecalis]MBS4752149.1 VOC family protein [Nocardioides faecalis]
MRIGHLIVPADDLDAQLGFYERLGLSVRFRDGDRYAALTDGTTTLGLAGPGEQPVAGRTVLSLEVDDLDAVVADLADAGTETGPVVVGPHERRVLVHDRAGNPVTLYEKLA